MSTAAFPAVVQREVDEAAEADLARRFHPLIARLYAARGLKAAVDAELGIEHLLPPDELPGIDDAGACLADAIEQQRPVLITGDYDADGATSTALLTSFIRACEGQCDFLVPDRFEMGYGLSPELAAVVIEREPAVVVTVDNGISSLEGVAMLRAAGIAVVITDHHLPGPRLPDANVIVNPNLADSSFGSPALAGVGVAFYVAAAVRRELQGRGWFNVRQSPNLKSTLDLVAVGTVADVVPLDRNNRVLVAEGLNWIRRGGARPGITALLRVANVDVSRVQAEDIAFRVAPRLNAAGRMSSMSIGIECLLADEGRALELARELHEINQERRAVEADMTGDALRELESLDTSAAAVCVYDASWHQGIVGIVAGRVRERSHRPTFACAPAGRDEHGRVLLRGSGRSIPGFHLRDALALIDARQPGLLLAFGGHAMAAGVTLTEGRLPVFRAAFERVATEMLSADQLLARELTDGSLSGRWLSLECALAIEEAGPWGQHFPTPLFHGVFTVLHARAFGAGRVHAGLTLSHPDGVIEAVQFNAQSPDPGTEVRVIYELTVDRYRGEPTPRLLVRYMEPVATHRQA